MQVQHTLVDAHLPAVIGVSTLTARRLAHNQLQELGGHSDRASDLQVLLKSLVLQLSAHLLDSSDVARSQSDSDAVDGRSFDLSGLN